MKTIVDRKNRAVIVTGIVQGEKIKGLAVAEPDDKFDEEFGTKLAMARYKAKKYRTKYRHNIEHIEWLYKKIDQLRADNIYNVTMHEQFETLAFKIKADKYPLN